MTKQLRIEAERLWKRGEELKDQLIKMQKENARLREALQEILKTNHMDYVLMKEIARAALKEKE